MDSNKGQSKRKNLADEIHQDLLPVSVQRAEFLQLSWTSKTWFMVKVIPFDGLLLFFENLELQKLQSFVKRLLLNLGRIWTPNSYELLRDSRPLYKLCHLASIKRGLLDDPMNVF